MPFFFTITTSIDCIHTDLICVSYKYVWILYIRIQKTKKKVHKLNRHTYMHISHDKIFVLCFFLYLEMDIFYWKISHLTNSTIQECGSGGGGHSFWLSIDKNTFSLSFFFFWFRFVFRFARMHLYFLDGTETKKTLILTLIFFILFLSNHWYWMNVFVLLFHFPFTILQIFECFIWKK